MNKEQEGAELIRAPLNLRKTVFLRTLFQFLRHTETHSPDNKIFVQSLNELLRSLQQLTADMPGSVKVTFQGEIAYINQRKVRPNPREFHVYQYLAEFLRQRALGDFGS